MNFELEYYDINQSYVTIWLFKSYNTRVYQLFDLVSLQSISSLDVSTEN